MDRQVEPGHDRELTERFRLGELAALRQLHQRYGPAVRHLVARSAAVPVDPVTRATFVAAWHGRRDFAPGRHSVLRWLLGIARQQVAGWYEYRCRRYAQRRDPRHWRAWLTPFPTPPGPLRDGGPVIDRLVVADEFRSLPADQQRVLELAFYDDLTREQVAAVTGLPPPVVAGHLREGLARLRRRWEVDGAAPGPRPAGRAGDG